METWRSESMSLRRLMALPLALALACSDSGGPDDGGDDTVKPPSDLTILRLAEGSPPLFSTEVSFYAVRGENREGEISFVDDEHPGEPGEKYLELRVDAEAPSARPDGTPIADGDSVLITVRVVDPARLLFQFEPAGLTFNPSRPAELRIHYNHADDDLDEDGDVDVDDATLELTIGIWRQENDGDPFERLGSLLVDNLEEVEAELGGFSRYALAY
jgi:hypothetical protein